MLLRSTPSQFLRSFSALTLLAVATSAPEVHAQAGAGVATPGPAAEGAAAAPAPAAPPAAAPETAAESAAPVWPAQTVILPIEVSNLTSEEASSFTVLFIEAYETASGGRVMPPSETERALAQLSSPAKIMSAAGAQRYLVINLVRMDSRTVVSVAAFDTAGKQLAREKMTAATLDDFEPIAERLAKALNRTTNVEETRTLDNVTKREGQARQRVASARMAGIRGGVVFPIGASVYAPLVQAALDVRFESPSHAFGIGVALLIPAGARADQAAYGGLSAEANGLYYLTETGSAPYLGAGFMMRILGSEGANGANVAPYGMLGYAFGRESETSGYLELRAAQNVTAIGVATEIDATTGVIETTYEYPFEPSLNAGVAF